MPNMCKVSINLKRIYAKKEKFFIQEKIVFFLPTLQPIITGITRDPSDYLNVYKYSVYVKIKMLQIEICIRSKLYQNNMFDLPS
jgi:hypothetical protein